MLIKELCSDYFWIMPKTPKYTEGAKIPYITSKNLRNGSIDYSNCKYVTEDDFNKLSTKRCILENDFLISMIGTLGEVAIVSKDDLPIYGQNMYLLRPDFSKISKKYLFYFLTSSYLKQKLLNITNGATQSYLHDTDIINQSIQNRTIEEQNSISHELDSITNALSAKKRELESLNELIKSQFIKEAILYE